MAGPIIRSCAPCHWVLLHFPCPHRTFLYIVYPILSDETELTLSVPLKYLPSSPHPCHTNRLSSIPGSHRLNPRTTHTTSITWNRGEYYLYDSSDESRACRCRHYRLYQACFARRRARASCRPRVTESRRIARFARTCSINGTCLLISPRG